MAVTRGAVVHFRVRVMYGAPKIHFLFAGGWQVGDPSRGADDDLDSCDERLRTSSRDASGSRSEPGYIKPLSANTANIGGSPGV